MKTNNIILSKILIGLMSIALDVCSQNFTQAFQTSSDSLTCLEISGELDKNYKTHTGTYTVVLIHYNTPIDTQLVNDNKSFLFKLKKDAYYAIRIYKKGFASKLISICTSIPEEVFNEKLLRFHFEAELIPENEFEQLNPEIKDFPIAIVRFDKTKRNFFYNEKYTQNIKRSLYARKNPLLF